MAPSALESRLAVVLSERGEEIAAAYLFGSHARGEGGPGSDVDVAVLLRDEPPRTLDGLELDLAADLERAAGRPVDLVVLNRAPAELVHRVLRDGRLLVEGDAARRIAFEVKRRGEYFDVLPHLLRYRGLEKDAG